jgi:hypothetical protein
MDPYQNFIYALLSHYVCDRSHAEIVGSNPTGAWMFVSIVVCCQVEVSATSWPLARGTLPTVVCRCVWPRNLMNEEALAHLGRLSRLKQTSVPRVQVRANLFTRE